MASAARVTLDSARYSIWAELDQLDADAGTVHVSAKDMSEAAAVAYATHLVAANGEAFPSVTGNAGVTLATDPVATVLDGTA